MNKRRRRTFKNEQGSERTLGSSTAECETQGHVLETGVDSAFQSVYAHSLQNFISRPEIWVWVPSGNRAADDFP